MRLRMAIVAAKLAGRVSRWRGGGATTLPGVVGLQLQPQAVHQLAKRLAGTIIVTGTNGKTTTARFIRSILQSGDYPVLHNQSGSNLLRGIASSLLLGQPNAQTWGLFEVDEATMPEACRQLQPQVVVVTNLFRDQLDRYGELAQTASMLRAGLEALPEDTTIILNADDPRVARLGHGLKQRIMYYGLDDQAVASDTLPHAADSVTSPRDGSLLEYSAVYYGHLGNYRSLRGDFRRPTPDISATKITLNGITGSQLMLRLGGRRQYSATLALPGLYNVYNAVAAAAAGTALDQSPQSICQALSQTAAAFGRVERIRVGRKYVWLGLIKNPTGANEVIKTLTLKRQRVPLLIMINDNFADGRDVSWLWDTDFEDLRSISPRVGVAGLRAADMAVRLKYAGWPPEAIHCYDNLEQAVSQSLSAIPSGGTLYVLPTYTAMLDLRKQLARQNHVTHYLD